MRLLLLGLTALTLTFGLVACSQDTKVSRTTKIEDNKADARIAAVLIYADWCPSCKIIEPKLSSARSQGPIEGVKYLTLDYTTRDKNAMFAAADGLGVGEAIRTQLGDEVLTGILLLVDIDNKKVVADLRKELSVDELRSAIVTASQV